MAAEESDEEDEEDIDFDDDDFEGNLSLSFFLGQLFCCCGWNIIWMVMVVILSQL